MQKKLKYGSRGIHKVERQKTARKIYKWKKKSTLFDKIRMAQGDDNIHKILKRIRANLKEKINLLNNKISKKENKPEFFQGTF